MSLFTIYYTSVQLTIRRIFDMFQKPVKNTTYCFFLFFILAIASTFYFTTAKAANSKNPDTIIETEEASTEEQSSITPQSDKDYSHTS